MQVQVYQCDSPLGSIRYGIANGRIVALVFADHWDDVETHLRRHAGAVKFDVERAPGPYDDAFARYFSGQLTALDALPIESFGTAFQRQVWQALLSVPAGKTASYGEIAQKIGKPKAVRAVGLANGANPISLRVPCHRVIGADGSLTGYGSGVSRKAWLLEHEAQAG